MTKNVTIKKKLFATMLGLGTAALASGCVAGAEGDETTADIMQPFTNIMNGVCSTNTQIAAELTRATMEDLGRYRPGLDLVRKVSNGHVILTSTGETRCASRGGCPRLKSLLKYQGLTWQQTQALTPEFPFMASVVGGSIANLFGNTFSDEAYPNVNQVISHDLTFAYTMPAPAIGDPNGCGLNLTYHCFTVSGLPSGKTATDLVNNISALNFPSDVKALTRIFVDSSNKLCIDPDGIGDDQSGGGSTGGSTCVDGGMAIAHQPGNVGNCCTTPNGTGYLVQNASVPDYMSCKMSNAAAGKSASADSTNSNYPASNTTDSSLTSYWKANDSGANHWAKVDLGSSTSIKGVVFSLDAAPATGTSYGYKIETSLTGSSWTSKKSGSMTAQSMDVSFASTSVRHIRVTLTSVPSGRTAAISNIRAFTE